MTFIPRHNAAAEHIDWVLWAQKLLLDQAAQIERLSAGLAAASKQTATGASQTAVINNRLSRRGVVSRGLPDGGYRGATVTQDLAGIAKWTTPIGSIVPKFYIVLEEGASLYEVNPFGAYTTSDAAKTVLPSPLFEESAGKVVLDWPISWADEHENLGDFSLVPDPMPIQLEVYVVPHEDGQEFEVALPSSFNGSGGAPWNTVVVYNSTAFTASVLLRADRLVYDGGVERPTELSLAPGEYFAWKVDNVSFDQVAHIHPFWGVWAETSHTVSAPMDSWYWRNVRALENHETIVSPGTLSASTGELRFGNSRQASVRIGKVTASVGTAGASDIEIQVLLNGVTPIFTTPLTIPATGTFAAGVPDAGGYTVEGPWFAADDVLVLLHPDDYFTVDIVSVGGGSPADLTVQVYYG